MQIQLKLVDQSNTNVNYLQFINNQLESHICMTEIGVLLSIAICYSK